MKRRRAVLAMVMAFSLLAVSWAGAEVAGLGCYQVGGLLENTGNYNWYYGCSPTSAGMMMGYYDRNGYGGLSYANLVPGGQAETSTYGAGPYKVNDIIASAGHIADFCSGGYEALGDDVSAPFHSFNCLADFMGTSQDSEGMQNGWTTFWSYLDGTRFTAQDAVTYGVQDNDGMYGMDEYFRYAGYGTGDITEDTSFYTQIIQGQGTDPTKGFTFADYKAEIDAGREVMIGVEGHTMVGYGYDEDGNIYIYDTWSPGVHTMPWGGAYAGRQQWGVVCFTPSGGSEVPLPPSFLLMVSGLAGLVGWKVGFRQK